MALGNNIVLAVPRMGVTLQGYISGTPKPGTMMQVKAGTAKVNGRFTYEVYAPGTDGDRRPVIILDADWKQGRIATTAYADGDFAELYCPAMGEEMNILKGDVAGTGDDFAIGDLLIADTGTGKFILTTGSPESEPFQCLETVTDPTADQLVHAMYTGY